MAVTPNYGWPVPVATDYVKDGWEAISDLGNAIDTTVAGLGSGLKLISTNTVTTQSTVNFTSCFSSTYQNYKVLVNPSASSTPNSIYLNLLNGTTSATTGYYYAFNGLDEAGSGANANGQNVGFLLGVILSNSPYYSSLNLDIFSPNLAQFTTFQSQTTQQSSVLYTRSGGGWHTTANAYDGFRLYTNTGTFSGIVSIYGYQK